MSPMMTRYLTSYLAWAKAMNAGESTEGMPDYSRYTGLCCNTYEYVEFNRDTDVAPEYMPDFWNDMESVASDALRDELEHMFIDDGLLSSFPFGCDDYNKRVREGTMYECPKRLAWIESKVDA